MDKLLSLGIDPWSMLLYLLNTGLLLVILTYMLYKPILKFIDQRRHDINKSIDESKHLQQMFEERLHESEIKRNEVEAELRNEIGNLHKFTEEKKAQLTAEMEQARTKMMQKAQEEIDQKKKSLLADAEQEVKTLMTKIILEIVENKVPREVIEESIVSSWKQYNK